MLIDSHCHIPHSKYEKTSEEVVNEAFKAGIEKLIIIGTSIDENELTLKTAKKFGHVYPVIGIYPHEHRKEDELKVIKKFEKQLVENLKDIVAIGECGIDITKWQQQRPVEKQKLLFEEQVKLAIKYDLPLVIHNRNGDNEILEILNRYRGQVKGVLHCFVSNWEIAQKFLELGFYISFSGIITYKSGENLHETVRNIPLDKFLIETDAPYLAPQDADGKRPKVNEPKYVKITAQKVAELKNMPLAEIGKHSYKNTIKLFGLDSV